MKRDFDLIRSILLQVEAAPSGEPVMQLSVAAPGTAATLAEHLKIMIDEGLLDGEVISSQECVFAIEKLTWKGHDFLDAARSETIWNEGKAKLAKVGGSASLEIIKAVLAQIVKAHLGLP